MLYWCIYAKNLSSIIPSLHKLDNFEQIFKNFEIWKNRTLRSIAAKFNTKRPWSLYLYVVLGRSFKFYERQSYRRNFWKNSISHKISDIRFRFTHRSGRQFKIIFFDILDYFQYSDTNMSIFFHENSFIREKAKLSCQHTIKVIVLAK